MQHAYTKPETYSTLIADQYPLRRRMSGILPIKSLPAWHHIKQLFYKLAQENKSIRTFKPAITDKLKQLDRELSASRQYGIVRDSMGHKPQGKTNWLWTPLMEDGDTGAGILTLYSGFPIPLHDHPGRVGALLVLHGAVQISQYDIDHSNGNSSLRQLKRISNQTLYVGDVSFYTPGFGNIHSLIAQENQCTLLSVYLQIGPLSTRCWYFPLLTEKSGLEVIVNQRQHQKSSCLHRTNKPL